MNYKWTLLFLVHASNRQTRTHVDELIKILKSAQNSEDIKVLILYGGLKCSITEGYSNQVTLHEIVKNNTQNQASTSELRRSYGLIDIGDDKKIKKIFSEIRNAYPSERFLLFTWDHGSGFGIFKTDPRERGLFSQDIFLNFEMEVMKEENSRSLHVDKENIQFEVVTNYAYEEDSNSRDLGGAKGIEKKKIKTSMLTNDELSSIIRYNDEARKVDLLIMMNCAMQLIETGYALNDAVEYLVAPETCIFWAGYDYKSIINTLCKNPEIETEALGKHAINTIRAYYENSISKDYFNDLVVSLVRPEKSLEVKLVIDDIAGHLINALSESFDHVKMTRKDCEDVTSKFVEGVPYHFIDLLSCVAGLEKITGNIKTENLQLAMHEYVSDIVKGSNYQGINRKNGVAWVNGCSIYYPPTAYDADTDFYYEWFYKNGNQQTLFAANCLWQDFLVGYFKYDRRNKKNIS